MNIGYARVSTQDQNLDLQKQALKQAGCKKIFEDQLSGSRGDRPGLARALEILRAGDTLVVWKLDRLGRSVKHLVDLVAQLQEQNIQFKSLTDNIDTSTTSGRFFFHVIVIEHPPGSTREHLPGSSCEHLKDPPVSTYRDPVVEVG